MVKSKTCLSFIIVLSMFSAAGMAQRFTVVRSGEGVEVSENGKKALFYQQAPKSLNGQFLRAGYVHPLYNLNGVSITEDFPEDHPHHRGIFWAWHQIVIKGKHIGDAWSCEHISWLPGRLGVKKKAAAVTIRSEMFWQSPLSEGASATSIIKENTVITIHKQAAQYRLVDFDITLTPLMDSIQIGGSEDPKGYSGFSLRLNLPADIQFISNGKNIIAQETAVTAGPWMDFRGAFDEKGQSGITLFCHADSPASEIPWILRSEKSMQNVAFPGNRLFLLPKKGLNLRYRLVIHDNTLTDESLSKLYSDYIR